MLNENTINKIIKETINETVKEVDRFTPYTAQQRERNFSPFRGGDMRSPEERNPSYAAAKKAAEERRRQREMEKQNGNITEDAAFWKAYTGNMSDEQYADYWFDKYIKPYVYKGEKAMTKNDVYSLSRAYEALANVYKCHPIKADKRLYPVKEKIYDYMQKFAAYAKEHIKFGKQEESTKHISLDDIREAINSVFEDMLKG